MPKPPTFERYTEIEIEYRNRGQGGFSRGHIWDLVGELLMIVEAMAKEDTMNARRPSLMSAPEWNGSTKAGAVTFVGAHEVRERALEAAASAIVGLPRKPPTPGPSEWKRMTPEQQSAHFAAVQAYEASMTPEDIAAQLAAENEAEQAHRANYSGWKEQFAADAP